MQRSDAVGLWLSDGLLPGVVIVLGGILLIRGIRWTESRYQHRLDERIAAAIDRTDVASESLKRSRMIVQAAGWVARVLLYLIVLFLALDVLGISLAVFYFLIRTPLADQDASEGSGVRQPSLAISVPLLQHVVLTEAGSHA
jgi:hypothetical protein